MNSQSELHKRDISIEILRIIGCFLVIWAHIQLQIVENGQIYRGRLLFSSIIGDDVPIFMLITGFYIFRRKTSNILIEYKNKILTFIKRIWIPSVILIIMTCILTPFLDKMVSWNDIRTWGKLIEWNVVTDFILKNSVSGYAGHLWYICFYLKMLILFPILTFLCQNERHINIIRRLYLGISFVNIWGKDIGYFTGKQIWDLSSFSLDENFTYIFLGFELYLFNKKIAKKNNKKILCVTFLIYVFGIVLKMILQMLLYKHSGLDVDSRFMWLQCLPCYLTSSALLIFFSNLKLNCSKGVEKVILFLGKNTMLIYLFHMLVIQFTGNFRNKILIALNLGTTPFEAFGYYVISGLCVFCVSLVGAIVFDYIYNKILLLMKNMKFSKY